MDKLTRTVQRLAVISRQFMPARGKAIHSSLEEDGMHASRLLANAELERLIEEWAEDMNSKLAQRNKQSGGLPPSLRHSVLLHFEQTDSYPPEHLSAQTIFRQVRNKSHQDRLVSALRAHASLIEQNNGVSQKTSTSYSCRLAPKSLG